MTPSVNACAKKCTVVSSLALGLLLVAILSLRHGVLPEEQEKIQTLKSRNGSVIATPVPYPQAPGNDSEERKQETENAPMTVNDGNVSETEETRNTTGTGYVAPKTGATTDKNDGSRSNNSTVPISKCPGNLLSVPPRNRVFIHVGKTGGSSLISLFKFRFEVHDATTFHKKPPRVTPQVFRKPRSSDHLIISIRDPINRLISAWYWHGRNARTKACRPCPGRPHADGMKVSLVGTFNKFAEKLENDKSAQTFWDYGCMRHFCFNYESYFSHLQPWISHHPCQVHIIRQEHLEEDCKQTFGFVPKIALKEGSHRETKADLSPRAIHNLRKRMDEEYRLYHWLLDLKRASLNATKS